MVTVPVRSAIGFLAVEPQEDDPPRAATSRQRDARRPAVAVGVEVSRRQTLHLILRRHLVDRVPRTSKRAIDLRDVDIPPLPIHRKQGISPRSGLIGRVRNDHASGFFRGRPRRLAPGSDPLDVVSVEAWATGKADDCAVKPAATVGRSMRSLVSMSTATPCSIKCLASRSETSTGTPIGKRPRSIVSTGFFEVTTI